MNTYYMYKGTFNTANELYHYGVKGMKWGRRKRYDPAYESVANSRAAYKQAAKQYRQSPEAKQRRVANAKKAAKIGAAVAVTALAAYGAYKVNQYVKSANGAIAAKKGYEAAEKMFSSTVTAMNKTGTKMTSGIIKANSGAAAASARAAASNDNFRTAMKNVVNYSRSGQKLRDLAPASFWESFEGSEIRFG